MRPGARPRCGAALLLLCFAALAAGCATNPVTGRSEMVLMSPAREAALGKQAAAQVAQEIGLVEDAALNQYVRALGARLAANSPRRNVPYQFFVADMPEPNAFALPGGYVYVSRGLLALSNSEAELANVIGHEIGHVAARHSAQRETRALGANLLTVLGVVAAGASGNPALAQATSQLGQVAAAGLIASYGRDQERQADEVGQNLAAQSGWNPAGMSAFLSQLRRESVLRSGSERLPSFLDSHPATGERVRTTAERARSLRAAAPQPIAATPADFYQRLRGLAVGPNPSEGLFRNSLFLHPTLDLAMAFPAGWRTQNQKQAVAAQAPEKDALFVLEAQGPSGDPSAAATAFAQEAQVTLRDGRSVRGARFPSYRANTRASGQSGEMELEITWVAHPSGMFRITGAAPPQRWSEYAESFRAAASSLRGLSKKERRSIRYQRLEVAVPRRGENLERLSKRVRNRWSLEETAVANNLDADRTLRAGQPIKVVVDGEAVVGRAR